MIPALNILYDDGDGNKLYLFKDEAEYYLFVSIHGPVTISRLKEFQKIFTAVVLGLIERGLDHVCTWIKNDEKSFNFATFFGFEETGFLKVMNLVEEREPTVVKEMMYVFPELDD